MTPRPSRVLFVCTHDSARSQMAEALPRWLGGDRFEGARALRLRALETVRVDLIGRLRPWVEMAVRHQPPAR